ncbi:holo-ACP synthase [Sesbania bispinosa]|nr:holo-ACP synthase [Sesbania bispinosa]
MAQIYFPKPVASHHPQTCTTTLTRLLLGNGVAQSVAHKAWLEEGDDRDSCNVVGYATRFEVEGGCAAARGGGATLCSGAWRMLGRQNCSMKFDTTATTPLPVYRPSPSYHGGAEQR